MSLKRLQEKIGVTPDGSFGPKTLNAASEFFGFSKPEAAHFFGQTSHETGGFSVFTENLNYSATGLKNTFASYFPGNLAELYARQPVKIASRVYANRMGNGSEESKDGWKFRGRGAIQLTGRTNYKDFSEYIGNPEILTNPDLVASEYAFESALYFFKKNGILAIAIQGVTKDIIRIITKKINGGYNGLEDRESLTNRYYSWLT